jgi:hybrid cluster-associated redox disulfide protein
MRKADRLSVTAVDDVMQRWPTTLRVFIQLGMKCIGCPIAPFHSVEDACRVHALDETQVVSALIAAIDVTRVQASAASTASSTRR